MDKIFELFKLFLTEPEKVRGNILSVIKVILTIIFAEWLYRKYIGEYHLINFLSLKDWITYVLSGQIFICILTFLSSSISLFQIFPVVSAIPFWILAKTINVPENFDKNESNFLRFLLKKFNLLDINAENGTVSVMNNTYILKDIVSTFNEAEGKKEVTEIKDTFLSEIVHTYFIFCLIYYIVLNSIHHYYLNIVIIIGFVLLVFVYVFLVLIIDLMHKVSKEFVFLIDWAYSEEVMKETMKDAGFYLQRSEIKLKGVWQFYYNEKKYLMKVGLDMQIIDERMIRKCVEVAKEDNSKLIVFTNKQILNSAMKTLCENKKNLLFYSFENESKLITMINSVIKWNLMI